MPASISFDEYQHQLARLTPANDPTIATADSRRIRAAAATFATLPLIDRGSLARLVEGNPDWVPALGLVVGLSQEKLKNTLRHHLNTSGWMTLARSRSLELVTMLDEEYELVRLLRAQRHRNYDFGDILVARAGTRVTAVAGATAGRRIEDAIEQVAQSIGLRTVTRTRFTGSRGRSAPCDLAVLDEHDGPVIVVAAKGFDSTGSKLTDAVREIEDMAEVRLPRQYVMAAIDGIGWLSRRNDLLRIYQLWDNDFINGMYTLAGLDTFENDLRDAAARLGLLQ